MAGNAMVLDTVDDGVVDASGSTMTVSTLSLSAAFAMNDDDDVDCDSRDVVATPVTIDAMVVDSVIKLRRV